MGIVSGVVAFICIWWTVLFCVLPIGVTPHQQEGIGTAGSAPENPDLKFKALLTTAISVVVFVVIYILIALGLIDFSEIANVMLSKDRE
jgi:predicted secreted protein